MESVYHELDAASKVHFPLADADRPFHEAVRFAPYRDILDDLVLVCADALAAFPTLPAHEG